MRRVLSVIFLVLLFTGSLGITVKNQDNTMKDISSIFTGLDAIRVDGNGDGDIKDTDDDVDYVHASSVKT
jgi:autotransporter translocation and assembly factor TamB